MPAKRKGNKSQGSNDNWCMVEPSSCQPRGDKKKPQKVKTTLSLGDLCPGESNPGFMEAYDVDTHSYEWVNPEDSYGVDNSQQVPVTTDQMSVSELSVSISDKPGLASHEANLEKVLAEACEEQVPSEVQLSENKSTPTQHPAPSTEDAPLEQPPLCDTRQKKKKNKRKKPVKVIDELTEPVDSTPLFSEILATPTKTTTESPTDSVSDFQPPVSLEPPPVECIVPKEPVVKPEIVQNDVKPSKDKIKKRKRCVGTNLADSFSDQETQPDHTKFNEWITPRPLKPKSTSKENQPVVKADIEEPKTTSVSRQKKKSKSSKPKAEKGPVLAEVKQSNENMKQNDSMKPPAARPKNKSKNNKKQTAEADRIKPPRPLTEDQDASNWPMLWFRNKFDIFGLRRK